MKIATASDHAGFELKQRIIEHLKNNSHDVKDFGTNSSVSCDYTDYAAAASAEISKGRFERGVFICGSGVGVSIVANKFPNVRAALCLNDELARLSREHNDANVICIGARFSQVTDALRWTDIFLKTSFLSGRHKNRVDKIKKLEEEICAK